METYRDQIIVGDCIEVMQQLPADYADVTFADPPFNLKKMYGAYTNKKDTGDYLNWCRQWLLEMVRITKSTGSIFVHNIPKWLTYYAGILNEVADFRHWIAWAPTAPMATHCKLRTTAFCITRSISRLTRFIKSCIRITDVGNVSICTKTMAVKRRFCIRSVRYALICGLIFTVSGIRASLIIKKGGGLSSST